ncbi:hypothetical protein [Cellulomonas sp. KH9]|uniref:hypothetical protein n=1 Tax=Cellulomonas sp. KH9 TaxID=1855324 RepID=UPI0008E5DF1B|nr:hypothetical protein [Cellulomonas sp. KH9]SFK18438.1 hypothetical protein SAMN05216467_2378 [Cellulomonas sp. KH9]
MDFWALSSIALLAVCILWRSTFGFALVAAVQQVFRVAGLTMLADSGQAQYSTAWMFLASVVAFLTGYFTSEFFLRNLPARPTRALAPLRESAVWAIVLVAGALGTYHLFVGGLPIFSDNIETERFDFSSSGLFGIPGRMYLFGIPIAWVIASANARALGMAWPTYRPWRVATAALVLTTLLSGFKGDAMSLVLTIVALYIIISGTRITLGEMVRRFWWTGALAVGYFAAVAALYPTYSASGQSVWVQLSRRLTTVPAEPVAYAIEGYAHISANVPVFSDLGYFIRKYSGNEAPGSYSFERAVSASMIGVDPASSAWTTPVTVSGFAEAYVSFGFAIALIMILLAGVALSYFESAQQRSTTGLVARAVFGLMITGWLAKGGLAYHAVNYVAVVAFLAAIGTCAAVLLPGQSHRRSIASFP